MVKNTTGGSKTKGQARKLVSFDSKASNKMLRISTDIYEVYAQVTKNLGNGMCHVLCADTKTRLCHIRGKFRGRGKRDNLVGLGSWLLVGIREWEKDKDDTDRKFALNLKFKFYTPEEYFKDINEDKEISGYKLDSTLESTLESTVVSTVENKQSEQVTKQKKKKNFSANCILMNLKI
jgi:initiation factor 1A